MTGGEHRGSDLLRAGVRGLRQDASHGAAQITAEALTLFGRAAARLPEGTCRQTALRAMAEEIASARPAMAGLGNAVRRLGAELALADPSRALALSELHVAALRRASEAVAARAAELFTDPATLVTCSYGTAVPRLAAAALTRGNCVTAVVYEPDASPDAYGLRLAEELRSLGVECRVDSELPGSWAEGQAVVIGADSVTSQEVLNGSPSLALASAAAGLIPVYALSEEVKMTGGDVGGEPGMDRVPLQLFTAVVTEAGPLSPDAVRSRICGLTWRP